MANYDLTYEGSRVQGILDTGDELQTAGYIFRGEATPSTVPGTPTERVVYIGGPGTYTNFGSSITVGAGCICVFKYTGSAWSNQVINTGLSDAISSAINSEATTRSEADTALQNAINSEATTRSEADTALQNAINSEATTRSETDTALQNAITAINNNIGNGYVFAGVATPSTSPVTGKVFYLAVQAGTYTNFEDSEETPLAVTAGINILKNTGTGWVLDQVISIDDEPTQGSANLVKSGGVLNSIIQNGPAFDLSAYNAQGGVLATYADLSAALTALNALPADFKKGGMSFKFVLTSDNKYVQYRLMANAFSIDVTQWAVIPDTVEKESLEYIKVETDSEGRIINATTKDGKGIVGGINVNDFKKEFDDFMLIAGPVSSFKIIDSPEYIEAKVDKNGKLIEGIREDGTKVENGGVQANGLELTPEGMDKFSQELINKGFVNTKDFFGEIEFVPILKNLKRSAIDANTGAPSVVYTPLSLLVYADIHHDTVRNNRVLGFKDRYDYFIDDALLCGDIAGGTWESTFDEDFYHAEGMLDVLKVLGNHDVDNAPSRLQIYNRYLENIDNWGVVQPTGASENGFCYYYKDYSDSKVRLIGLDYTELGSGSTQLTWLESVLTDARQNGLSVICTMHIPFNSEYELFDTTFNCIDYNTEGMVIGTSALEVVDTFIQAGGDFICWLFGHIHTDWFGKYTQHNNQIFISLAASMINAGNWEDSERVEGTKTEDLFSLISFDTFKKTISLYRVGAQYDRYMRHKESITLDYANKKLLGSF